MSKQIFFRARTQSRLAIATVGFLLLASMAFGTVAAHAAASTTVTFNYNGTDGSDGSAQTWTVPAGVFFATFDVFGAEGREAALGAPFTGGGLGGEAKAGMFVVPGDTFTIRVGGQGSLAGGGGFNGGGDGGGGLGGFASGAGGGASDVRKGGNDLDDRVLVAGGGGGAGIICVTLPSPDCFEVNGGSGGGLTGGPGNGTIPGRGGNQDGTTGSGTLGEGSSNCGGGGGGGYWGGSAGGCDSEGTSSGGGGSGFGPTGVTFQNGARAGHGLVTITYTPAEADLRVSIGANPNPVLSGSNLTYTMSVKNFGPNTAFGSLLISLPSAFSQFVNATTTKGSCRKPAVGQSGTMICSFGAINKNATVKVTEVVKIVAPPGSTVSQSVVVSSQTPDPFPLNNTATASTLVI